MRRVLGLLFVVPVGAVFGSSMGCESHTCVDDHSCLFAPDASLGDATPFDAGALPDAGSLDAPGCDRTSSPSADGCVVTEEYGIFVAPTGSDTSEGSRAQPVRTIGQAAKLALLRGSGRVYVCDGSYPEAIVLSGGAPLAIFGGLTCPGADAGTPWAYAPTTVATFQPSGGLPLHVDGYTGALHLEDLAFLASDATGPGQSSIAAFVARSPNVSFTRVAFTAGKGANGADGTTPTEPLPAASKGVDGADVQSGKVPLTGPTCACPSGEASVGGTGGLNGGPGSSGLPALSAGQGGVTGASCDTGSGTNGSNGTPGPSAGRISTLGTLTATGWTPQPGNAGVRAGGTGQGGGGGNSLAPPAGSPSRFGGGGGCGGCGGGPGTSGSGGGASIALLDLESGLSLTACTLKTANAGDGGKGAPGQPGVGGGAPGSASVVTNGTATFAGGCPGASGGKGGDGSSSGGGAGGVSAGVLVVGTHPTQSNDTIVSTGEAGLGGRGGDGSNAGPNGAKESVLSL